MYKNRQVTVIIPALNEAPSIGDVVNGLFRVHVCDQCSQIVTLHTNTVGSLPCPAKCNNELSAIVDQIIVGDNGSSDNTADIARSCGAMVVTEPERGYGAACLAALAAPVEKDLIVFVDGDNSVVPEELPTLLQPIIDGADMVIGSRTLGQCEKGALSIPQTIGNRLAIALMRLLWRGNVTDLGPFRAVTQNALNDIQMSDRKFGWTVEMQIRALQLSLKTVEVPVSTLRRIGKSKISGTVKGVIGAAHGILGTIGKLYWRQLTGANQSTNKSKTYTGVSVLDRDSGEAP